jgi:hypothetical protein
VTGTNLQGVTGTNLAGVTGTNIAGVTGTNILWCDRDERQLTSGLCIAARDLSAARRLRSTLAVASMRALFAWDWAL